MYRLLLASALLANHLTYPIGAHDGHNQSEENIAQTINCG